MSAIESDRGFRVGGVGSVVAGLASLVSNFRDARRVRRELSCLSDRELDDIGLCRGDIELLVRSF